MRIDRYQKNKQGRDLIVGDIHGNFSLLKKELARIGFDESKDRLFSVGDLVDRGPESDQALDWVAKPWFFPVRGNHEEMAIDYVAGVGDRSWYISNGGAWNVSNPSSAQHAIRNEFLGLPLAIELETDRGLVCIIHADCPRKTWAEFRNTLQDDNDWERDRVTRLSVWNRQRVESGDCIGVSDIRALVVGHTPVPEVQVLGNVHHIDTGGWLHGRVDWARFTILDASTLEQAVFFTRGTT